MASTASHYIDQYDLPSWGTASDGRRVRLEATESLLEAFAAWQAAACQHSDHFTGRTVNAGGAEMYRRYCRECGIATTQWLPHRTVEGTTITVIDEGKRDARIEDYIRRRREGLDALASGAANDQQEDRRSEYGDYLSSTRWRELRAKVVRRAAGLCEGCLSRPPAQVHHLTYEHIRAEFAFELVAVCAECHQRLHAIEHREAAE